MKTSIKILLLFCAIILCTGAVLIYLKTVMAPPQALAFDNQYNTYLHNRVEEYQKASAESDDDEFEQISDLANRLKNEDRINNETFDNEYSAFLGIYSPRYADRCFSYFRKPEWKDADLKEMEKRISLLTNLKTTGGNRIITENYPETQSRFNEITDVIKNYREARALASSSFSSLEDSKKKINRARQFAQDSYLRYNTSLMSSLNNLPSRLENSNYNSVKSKISSLANFRHYTETQFNSQAEKASKALNEYVSSGVSVYGKIHPVDDLRSSLSRYKNEAREYFALKNY